MKVNQKKVNKKEEVYINGNKVLHMMEFGIKVKWKIDLQDIYLVTIQQLMLYSLMANLCNNLECFIYIYKYIFYIIK